MPTDTMRLSPDQRLAEERREAAWLRAYESGDATIADLTAITGLGRRQLFDRLKRARENREVESDWRDDPLDVATYVEILDARDDRAPRGEYYDLESGYCSVEGNRLVAIGAGPGVQGDKARSRRCPDPRLEGQRISLRRLEAGRKGEEQIKQHRPDPDGLKGGVG